MKTPQNSDREELVRAERPSAPSAAAAPAGSGQLAIGVALPNGLALVVTALSAHQAELHLGAAVAKVELERHHREAALPDLAGQPGDRL